MSVGEVSGGGAMVVVFLGPPGVGKGTQADRLSADEGLLWLSTGEVLRAAAASGTELGKRTAAVMERGDLAPDELVTGLVMERLEGMGEVRALLDGYPRTTVQAEALEGMLEGFGTGVTAAVEFTASDEVLRERVLGRAATGVEVREDDTQEALSRRLEVYRKSTAPLSRWYEERGLLRKVDAIGSVEEVYAGVREALGLR